MKEYVFKRILAMLPVVLIVAVITFSLIHIVPGDPAIILGGETATVEDLEKIRKSLGLDKPLVQQFLIWSGNVLQGDLGVSPGSRFEVSLLIKQRIEPTLSIGVYALVVKMLVAIPLGVLAAWKANTWIDRSSMIIAVLSFSIPVFWLEYNMIFLFAVNLGWMPAIGYEPISGGIASWFKSITMPSIAVGLVAAGLTSRVTRSTMLEILNDDYIRTARAKGLAERVVLIRHALRNAAVPILTIIGLGLATMIGGLIVTEQVFAIPGMGRLVVDSISKRDYPVIQGIFLIIALFAVAVNLIIDLAYVYFDPRIRY